MSAREQFDDERLERLQLRVETLEKALAKLPLNGATLIPDVAITTTATRVEHRLGRTPKGFVIAKASPDSALGLSVAQPNDMTVAVHLEASANATFSIWFW